MHALRGVSLRIERGEYVAIMGPSGSGKSTLMNILGCLDVPTAGTYQLAGVDVAPADRGPARRRAQPRIGFVFQQFNLLPACSALAQRRAAAVYAGLRAAERRRRALRRARGSAWPTACDHRPSELSGGQQQRVAVARALVTEPALILADEPTGNLDSRSTADVLGLFDELHAAGRTIVLITHEDDVAAHAGA